jgi:hypothetical protein
VLQAQVAPTLVMWAEPELFHGVDYLTSWQRPEPRHGSGFHWLENDELGGGHGLFLSFQVAENGFLHALQKLVLRLRQ